MLRSELETHIEICGWKKKCYFADESKKEENSSGAQVKETCLVLVVAFVGEKESGWKDLLSIYPDKLWLLFCH